jgi:hypothetical protein
MAESLEGRIVVQPYYANSIIGCDSFRPINPAPFVVFLQNRRIKPKALILRKGCGEFFMDAIGDCLIGINTFGLFNFLRDCVGKFDCKGGLQLLVEVVGVNRGDVGYGHRLTELTLGIAQMIDGRRPGLA